MCGHTVLKEFKLYHLYVFFRLDMYVDDVEVATGRLPSRESAITVREDGGLYLGGIPQGLKVDEQAITDVSLDGCLSDVVLNKV